ncbi:class II aldolase/adducin family protein [Effusibacillus lacus]|uniref:Aldolase n=1 Tax=Effusibacillus lacus TaxID=1348429 RepID=A0A292YP81_9BACL|nr:class II aldolase/adducin family protein [Effusibacillus lacus]TCS71077.1 ribulose-5-phosphate 4-epimerase/fuculose-1-phosphate aldolase [Effusibacillus lacus]GAX90721.1 aldolase [Effusibacillus lacus]
MSSFIFSGEMLTSFQKWFADGLRQKLESKGYRMIESPQETARLVLNFADPQSPRPYRRKAQATYVVTLIESNTVPESILRAGYPILIRALSNLLIYIVRTSDVFETYFVTLEQGYYRVPYEAGQEDVYFDKILERLEPLATSNLIINNDFHQDLPEELWEGDEVTEKVRQAGNKIEAMNLWPAPFPIQEILPPEDFRHVKRLYGIGGLSYGNLSARKDSTRFWMSGSGVNKGNLRQIGQDMLLIKGFDSDRNTMLLSVPPNVQPRRVSVDAIEHWMIYTEHPEVGAIVHIHAWMEGIPSTQINYPCGTVELAKAVAELVRQADDPTRAVIGLKNHGLTITGRDLDDIFERIEGRIIPQVPMA